MGGAIVAVDIGHGRGWLEDEAAKSQARIDAALGHPQQITEAGRDWQQQNVHYQHYLKWGHPIALSPDGPPKGNGPSIHQRGRAKDTDERVTALLNDHGWFHTVYRNGVLVEPWHYEYFPERDNHRHEVVTLVQDADGVFRYRVKTKDWDEMATKEEIRAVVADEINKRSRVGAYKIVKAKGNTTMPGGPHVFLTGPGGAFHLTNDDDVDLMRRYIKALPYVDKSNDGEELFTVGQLRRCSQILASLKPIT